MKRRYDCDDAARRGGSSNQANSEQHQRSNTFNGYRDYSNQGYNNYRNNNNRIDNHPMPPQQMMYHQNPAMNQQHPQQQYRQQQNNQQRDRSNILINQSYTQFNDNNANASVPSSRFALLPNLKGWPVDSLVSVLLDDSVDSVQTILLLSCLLYQSNVEICKYPG